MREVRAGEVLASGLRRAVDPRVIGISMLTAIAGLALSHVLHLWMPRDSPDALVRLVVVQVRTLFTLVPNAVGSAAALCVVIAREHEVAPTFRLALTRFPFVYVAQLFGSFAVGFGLACFIVPAFYIGVVTSLITPVALEEGVGPLAAWGRCRELIEGRGDAVTAVVLAAWTIMGLLIIACLLPLALPRGFREMVRAIDDLTDPLVAVALVLARFGYGAIWAGVSGVLYVRLRERELPSEAEKIARVFA